MELFRSHPSLCSLFLRLLGDWGADTLDWSLLRDETFVDRFLRQLLISQEIEDAAIFQACSVLLQPSVGGLLAVPCLVQGGHFKAREFEDFVEFALRGSARRWEPMEWFELSTLLEAVCFRSTQSEKPKLLASMIAQGWVPAPLQSKFFRRVWQTCQLSLAEKTLFFQWLYGEHQWDDLPQTPKGTLSTPFSLKVACHRSGSGARFSSYRRGFSASCKEAAR